MVSYCSRCGGARVKTTKRKRITEADRVAAEAAEALENDVPVVGTSTGGETLFGKRAKRAVKGRKQKTVKKQQRRRRGGEGGRRRRRTCWDKHPEGWYDISYTRKCPRRRNAIAL